MARNTNMYSAHWVGSAGFATSKMLGGQTIVSQKSLGPTNERTPIQVGNEMSMARLVGIGRMIKPSLAYGFKELKVKNRPDKCRNTTWGAFTGENRKYTQGVFDYTIPDDPEFLPENMLTAKGTIYPQPLLTATGDVSLQSITATWEYIVGLPGQGPTDGLQAIFYNETTDTWGIAPLAGANRADETWSYTVTLVGFSFIITDVVRLYAYFGGDYISDYTKESDSVNMIVTLSA
jgi:hypothetical protein